MVTLKQKVLRGLGIEDSSPWLLRYQAYKRRLLGTDARHKTEYLKHNACAKLHLGSSNHLLDGWLNTDLYAGPGVMSLDATSAYPFADGTFDFIYSEHMIEHVPYEAALRMLSECHRVLKPGGVIRIVTPDLAKILSIYPRPVDSTGDSYLQWMATTFTPGVTQNKSAQVVNAFFRLWGHQFIYDEATLKQSLERCGFVAVARHELHESNHVSLQGLEHTTRYPDGLLNYESICLEGSKG